MESHLLIDDNKLKASSDQPARTLERGLAILSAFTHQTPSLTLTEISERTGVPKSTAVRFLRSLEDSGFLERDSQGRYRVGLRAFEVGNTYVAQRSMREIAEPILMQLTGPTGQSANLAILDKGQVVHLATYQPDRPIRFSTPLGYRDFVHCTGLGKALIADLPEEELNAIVDNLGLPARTEHTITDPERLKAHLHDTRSNGYAIDDEETAIGLRCVAAPVRDGQSRVVAAISVAGHALELQGETLTQAINEVLRAADALSVRLSSFQAIEGALRGRQGASFISD